jgi:hypothetical protein
MIHLNVLTLVELTGRLLPGMVERRHGRVLNVASRVGLQLLRFVPWRLVMRTAAPPRRTNAEENR